MIRLGLVLVLFALAGAVRFHEFLPDGATHFHGIPVERYVSSWNRLMEIGYKLNGHTGSFVRFEELEWDEEDAQANPFLYQGDIVLSEDQLDHLVESYEVKLATKEGRCSSHLYSIDNPSMLWDPMQFPIPWSVDVDAPPVVGASAIHSALDMWEDQTCVTFQENGTGQNGHLQFYSGHGCEICFFFHLITKQYCFRCSSPLGNAVWNKISIGQGCQDAVTINHEVGHSLGLFHVQSRADANRYIDFMLENVDANETENFLPPIYFSFEPTTHGIPYDYGSAMHNGRFALAKEKGLATMLPKDRNYNATLGQRFEIAFTDAKEINMMYCDHVCRTRLPCLRGGYPDPKDCTKCRCPTGFGGKLCQRLAETRSADCGDDYLVATSDYQTLTVAGKKDCIFRIKAPQGMKIEIVLTSATFQGENSTFGSCEKHFVEIKYGAQFQTAGARFCPRNLTERKVMHSFTNEVIVLYNAYEKFSKFNFKFSLQYKIDGNDDEEPCVSIHPEKNRD